MTCREILLEKIKKKQDLESELKDQLEILRINEVDMTAPLVDAEDYPRGDIDLYKVRNARQRINVIKNDLNALMKEIAEGLDQHFSELKVDAPTGNKSSGGTEAGDKSRTAESSPPAPVVAAANRPSFAVVDSVTEGGPADECGLRKDDEVVEFGSVNAKNFQALQQLAEIAQHKLDQRVAVVIKRKRENGAVHLETIQLVPKKWSGRGYLGMVIKPTRSL